MKNQLLNLVSLLMICIAGLSHTSYCQISFKTVKIHPIEGAYVGHLATGDFNNDGRNDVAVRTGLASNAHEENEWKIFVYIQGADSTLLPPVRYSFPQVPTWALDYYKYSTIASGDVNNDGRTDLAIAWDIMVGVYYQNSLNAFDSIVFYPAGGSPEAIKIGDANNDGYNDIVCSLRGNKNLAVMYGETNGTLSTRYLYECIRSQYNDIEIDRIGLDSLNSVIRMNGSTGTSSNAPQTSVYRFEKDRSLGSLKHYYIPEDGIFPYSCAVGDFDGNGIREISYSHSPNHIKIWEDLSQTTPKNEYTFPGSFGPITSADLNCDGKDELYLFNGSVEGLHVISGNTELNFTMPAGSGAFSDAIGIADINGDDKPDVLSCKDYTGLSILINTTECKTTSINEYLNKEQEILYPNPCESFIRISNTKPGNSILLLNTFGQSIKSIPAKEGNTEVDLSELKSGLYLVVIADRVFKLVKNQ